MKSFASDNYSGVSPEILQAVIDASKDHAIAYGNDSYTHKAISLFKHYFGDSVSVYFVTNGTAANTLGLKAVTNSYNVIICSDNSHILIHEVGAPVKATGCVLLPVPSQNGKISATAIEETYQKAIYWGRHANIPKVVSIAQSTEVGTVYTVEELIAISTLCKKYNLIFHMDGCRLANAAVALNATLKALTVDVGVDVLSFGGTKNGMMFGEAIIFLTKGLDIGFESTQKQELQLLSKMRFLSAQFIPYLEDNIWHRNARHANVMCERLHEGLQQYKSINYSYPIQTNQIFASFPKKIIEATNSIYPYYVWNEQLNIVRLITSFDTMPDDVDGFLQLVAAAI